MLSRNLFVIPALLMLTTCAGAAPDEKAPSRAEKVTKRAEKATPPPSLAPEGDELPETDEKVSRATLDKILKDGVSKEALADLKAQLDVKRGEVLVDSARLDLIDTSANPESEEYDKLVDKLQQATNYLIKAKKTLDVRVARQKKFGDSRESAFAELVRK